MAQQKTATEQKEVAFRVVNTSIDLITGLGMNGYAQFLSPSWMENSGYSETELSSRPWLEFLHQDDSNAAAAMLKTLKSGQRVSAQELRLICKDGSIKYISWNWILSSEDELMYGIGRDITAIREQQKIQKEFIAVASHELRTPLTAIKGTLELIVDGVAGEVSTHALQLLKMSNDSCDHLLRMINNILDMDKIENGKLALNTEPIVLYDAVKHSVEANIHYGSSVGVIFVIKKALPNIMVAMDRDRIAQVMDNLLSNAAKYGSGADIVEVSMDLEPSNMVRVSIKDHGAGIDKTIEPYIFQKFIQGSRAHRIYEDGKIHGTGLGLSICKSLVELYGGKIGFFSQKGKGTTFYFDLPLWQVSESQQPVMQSGAPELGMQSRILVCEDEPLVRHVLEQLLTKSGFSVESASGAEEARQLLAQKHFDAMTCDLMMPDESGAVFMKKLKQDPKYTDFPIIIISAVASSLKGSAAGEALGAFDFLDKPIDKTILNETLSRLRSTISTRSV